jgi:predicted N-acetyltransferase YhbS
MQQTPSQITIREATSGDAGEVAAVVEGAFGPLRSIYRPTGEVAARQAERAKEGTRLVAVIDGQVVATVQFDSHQEHVHLIGLAVHPGFQRMGVARRLIDWVAAYAPTLGHDLVVLDTIKETGNVPLFEKLGFRVFDESVTTLFVSDTCPELHEVKMKRRATIGHTGEILKTGKINDLRH